MGSAVVKEHAEKAKRRSALPDPLAKLEYARLRDKTIDWGRAAEWLGCSRKWVRHVLGIRGIAGHRHPNNHGKLFPSDLIYPADAVSHAAHILQAEARYEIADDDWIEAHPWYEPLVKARGIHAAPLDESAYAKPEDLEAARRYHHANECVGLLQAAGGRTRRRPDLLSNGKLNHNAPLQIAGYDLYRLAGIVHDPSAVSGYRARMAEAVAEVDEIAVEDVDLTGFPFAIPPLA